MKHWGYGFAIILITLFMTTLFTIQPINVKADSLKTIVVPDNYQTIASAIGNASVSDTILVKNGTYYEQTLDIKKSVTLIGELQYQTTIVLSPSYHIANYYGGNFTVYDNCIVIETDKVKFSGFRILSPGGDVSVKGNNNQIVNNTFGTQKTHIQLEISGVGNQIIGNSMPVLHINGNYQIATDNNAFVSASGNFNFIARNFGPGIAIMGSNNTITGNACSNGAGAGIQVINSSYNTISNNSEVGAQVGISVGYPNHPGGSYNIFSNNLVEKCTQFGIIMTDGEHNTFSSNIIRDCGLEGGDFGLAFGSDKYAFSNNYFVNNFFINNTENFGIISREIDGTNYFDSDSRGNYWDDYLTKYPNAIEVDNSGIGNVPYIVYANVRDNFPLLAQSDISKLIPASSHPWAPDLLIDSYISVPSSTGQIKATSTPAVPEFSWLTILPLLLTIPIVLSIVRKRLQGNVWHSKSVKKV